jgi:putative oxidoreductase
MSQNKSNCHQNSIMCLTINRFNLVTNNISEIIARITIGSVFIESGIGKLHSLPKVIAYFESLHIPLASIQAPLVSALELVCGILVLTGLFSRIAAIPLIGIMIVALFTAKVSDINNFSDLTGTIEFLYLVILIYLVANKSKFLSLNVLIQKYINIL